MSVNDFNNFRYEFNLINKYIINKDDGISCFFGV